MQKLNTDNQKRLPLFGGRLVLVIVVVIVVAATTLGTGLWAKYVRQTDQDALYVAENFYFESDSLIEPSSGEAGSYTLMEGVDSITVSLHNYTDDLRYAEVDIDYTVSLSAADNTIKRDSQSGTLTKNQKSTADVTFSNLPAGMYTITAVSEPYAKTLQATFTLREAETGISYVVNDNAGSPFLEVVITSEDYAGEAVITLPTTGVRPDNTDSLLKNAQGNSCTVSVNSFSSDTFLFFKDDPSAVYDKDDITAAIKTQSN